ncbi:MAG: TonB-dependent receptor [Cytophagales bacterium]|nr:TonB-dependent receptor [Cytophagales bacterium]
MKRLIWLLVLGLPVIVHAQDYLITGIVHSKGEALPGANISIQGTATGTIADANGAFQLTVPAGSTIEISFIGYITKEIVVSSSDELDIELVEDATRLEELVVVGYGAVKKSDLTGSIVSLKSEDILSTSVSSLDQGLQGKAAGVVVTQVSGQPGASTTIRIRGTSSINGNNEPLYIIDGVPIISDASLGTAGAVRGAALNPLASINPNDIESLEILKDASATAIYGARGANGVILVTTKRGRTDKPVISLDFYYGLQDLRHKIPMLNARELAELGNEAADNAGVPRKIIYASPTNLGEGTDWQEQIFRQAAIKSLQFSVMGGNLGTSYSVSMNYFDQEGIIIGSDFKRGNLRLNLDQKLSEKLTIGTSLNLNRNVLNGVVTDDESAIPSSVTSWALEFNPGLSIYDENGVYVYENNTSKPAVGNPVADAMETQQVSKSNRIIGNVYLNWDINDKFVFRSQLGGDAYFNKEQSFVPNFLKRAEASKGQAAVGSINGYTWLLENTLTYKNTINSIHSLNIVIGHSLQAFRSEYLYAATSEFDDNRLGFNAIQAGNKKTLSFTGDTNWQMQSIISRINYNLNEKYLLTVTGRVDGSSKFGENNKYGFFPSFALAWRLKEEAFLKHSEAISDLKLRGGYGRVGNEGIPPYRSLGLLEITEAYFGENEIAKGAGPASIENQELKWETTDQLDIGIDIGLFDNRLSIVSDVYFKKTTDLLLNAPVPYTSGFKSAYTNIGNLENKGVELTINSVNTVKIVEWNTSFNMAFNRNEITKLTGGDDEGLVGQNILGINGWTRIAEGQPIGTFYGYQTDGIIQLDEDPEDIPYFTDYRPSHGDRKYVDQNGDRVINEKDRVILGNANPDFSFGFGNNFKYKNWDLNIYIQGIYGNEIVNFNLFALESFDGNRNNSRTALERWTEGNPTNDYPRANATPRSNTFSDAQVEDGSYLRVRDITLKYSFPEHLVQKINLSDFKIYAGMKNFITWTNYSGYDPEVSRFAHDNLSMGADYGTYPATKIIMIGVNIVF